MWSTEHNKNDGISLLRPDYRDIIAVSVSLSFSLSQITLSRERQLPYYEDTQAAP